MVSGKYGGLTCFWSLHKASLAVYGSAVCKLRSVPLPWSEGFQALSRMWQLDRGKILNKCGIICTADLLLNPQPMLHRSGKEGAAEVKDYVCFEKSRHQKTKKSRTHVSGQIVIVVHGICKRPTKHVNLIHLNRMERIKLGQAKPNVSSGSKCSLFSLLQPKGRCSYNHVSLFLQ